MASYASEVKKELTSIEVHPEHAKAELAAFLRMNAVLSRHDGQMSLDIVTENPAIARRIFSLIKTAYGFEPQLIVTRKMKLKKNHQYLVRVAQMVSEIMADLEIYSPECPTCGGPFWPAAALIIRKPAATTWKFIAPMPTTARICRRS